MHPPPSTPTPRRFLLPKRGTQTSSQTPSAAAASTPRFQSTPRFGVSSSAARPISRKALSQEIEDVDDIAGNSEDEVLQDEEDRVISSSLGETGEDAERRRPERLHPGDEIVEESQSQDDHWSRQDGDDIVKESTSPEERRVKRRRLSVSPAPTSSPVPSELPAPLSPEEELATPMKADSSPRPSSDGEDHISQDEDEDIDPTGRDVPAMHQPTFRAAPRFKPTEAEALADGLPAAFSPQRRGMKYVPGGFAAELQGWLSDVKRWDEEGGVPCKLLAEKLGLRVHQRSTFREWEPPEGTNLIVAVSFGLFVPSRILRGAKYGGLNVHPSLLPDLRGPAPLHHALLNGDQYTGVSLQTLDHKNFDHGTVLAQTPAPGLRIPEDATLPSLTAQLAEEGAKMLVQGLRDGLYLPPVKDVTSTAQHEAELRHAPKLAKAESMINWAAGASLDGAALERRMRGVIQTFGSAWTELVDPYRGNKKRVIFKDVETVRQPAREQGNGVQCRTLKLWGRGPQSEKEDGEAVFTVRTEVEKKTGRVLIHWGGEDVWLRIGRATVQGGTEKTADEALKHYLVKERA
ncbi:formyl transferase domain-containing protein [Sarocladium implicatum]|nr:formyl transferase domain-containing protein [Sarocladium implicatum]